MVTCAPIACKHKVSGSLSLPSRGSFHLSLTVLFAIGHWVVFSLGRWASRLHAEFHVLGITPDPPQPSLSFGYGTFTLCGASFQTSSPTKLWSYRRPKPHIQVYGLGSSPFARRYLGHRFFFLFLRVLRCFSSPRFLKQPIDSAECTHALPCVGSPIRTSAGRRLFAPYRSLSQLVTSFIGSQCQGIRLMLFLT